MVAKGLWNLRRGEMCLGTHLGRVRTETVVMGLCGGHWTRMRA